MDNNYFDYNSYIGYIIYNFQEMPVHFIPPEGMLQLISIQHNTLRHRKNGRFCGNCKLGFCGSHVGTLHDGSHSPIPVTDHRIPSAYDMNVIKLCYCRQLQIDWQNILLCDLDRNFIKLPALGKISIWATNNLESIEPNIRYQICVYG